MASKRIKGLTVEIGGDTSKLGKALSEVDGKSKNLQKELRGVNSLLKLDPTNVELLKQKEELLTQSISETEKKLDILNQTMKKIDSGDIQVSEEQFRDLTREIEATKIKLNSYKGELDGLKKSTSDFADEADEAKKSTSEFASETKKADLSDFKKEIDDVKTSASDLKDEIKNTASEVAVSAAAISTAAIGAVATANEETKAMNSLQAQTGLTTQELEKYGGVIKSIYQNNFGESQEDIANAIAKIKQLTGETDPSKIQAMAENLYTMQDTFENFDIDETLRGVNGLMTNVNLTAEEAFDFLVTGTQRGLNYSGELADNIAEYSSLWGQAGFSSKEMFSILENGTKSGAYNLDKVNDFVKEFTISLSDGRIEENLSSFSDDTGDLFNAWKNGEATASEVFYSVIEDLKNTKTEQEALTTASNVWSSLGEDNALAVITSLDNVNTSYDNVKGKMNEIKEIKYDDVTSDFKTLGRTIETDVIAPLGKKLYPTAEKICDFLSDHTDDIIPTLKTILGITGSIWAGQKAQSFANSIKGLVTTYKTLKTATEAAKVSQQALNVAQSTNVIGAIVTAVGFLITAFTTLSGEIEEYNELKWSSSEAGKFAAEIDEIKGRLEETTAEITENLENTLSELDSMYTDNALIDGYQKKLEELLSKAELSPEEQSQLQTIVSYFEDNVTGFDEVWKKYVQVSEEGKIQLNGDLSEIQTEISNTIDGYQRLTNLTAINELSTTNSKNKITANQELSKVEAEINAKTQEVNESYSEFLGLLYSSRGKESAEETLKRLKNNNNEVVTNEAWGEAYNTYLSNSKKLEELKNTHNESVAEMNKLIMTGDDLSDVIKVLNGDYSDAAAVMMAYNAGMINLSDVQESEWESLTKLQKAAEDTGKNTVIGIVEGTNKYKGALAENSNGLANTVLSEYDSVMEIHSPSRAMHRRGVWTVQGLIEGMFSKHSDVERAGEVSAIKAKKGGQKVSLFSLGNNLVSGFVNGILTGNAFKSIGEAAQTVAKNAYTTIKDWLGIKSPSRKAAQLGDFFSQGFFKGITINKGKVQQASEELARAACETLKNNDVDFNLDVLNPKSSQAYEIALKYSNSQSQAEIDRLKAVEAKLDKVCETIEKTSEKAIYLDSDTLIGSTTNKYDNSMADYSVKKNRGW